ncbi:MAG: glycosyltransferase family A protein [Paludibacter sp.]|nr:glycosyltransferase family A protein [Paludibacter sp.]
MFNRPDTTQKVFNEIKKIKPKRLYIAADGPRKERNEIELCEYTREIVYQIDWSCKLKTLYRDENLGCKNSVKTAIDWFFSYEEAGIILEDDCVPDLTFFSFCETLLEKYKYNQNIKIISGTNYFFGNYDMEDSFCFLPFTYIWGWATWKDRWDNFLFNDSYIDLVKYKTKLKKICGGIKALEDYYYNMVAMTVNGSQNAWSPYLLYSTITTDGLNIVPTKNLITNIGDQSSRIDVNTGKENRKFSSLNMPTVSVKVSNIRYPENIYIDKKKLRSNNRHLSKCLFGQLYCLPIKFRVIYNKINKFKNKQWVKRRIKRAFFISKIIKDREIPTNKLKKFAKSKGFLNRKNNCETIALIIPCYKHAQYLRKCFESAVTQTRLPDKIIIINDASPDHSSKIIDEFVSNQRGIIDIVVINNIENLGQSAAINMAITITNCDLYMILNDDDFLLPNAISSQIDVFASHPEIHLFGTSSYIIEDDKEIETIILKDRNENKKVVAKMYSPYDCWKYKKYNDLNMAHTSSVFTRIAWEHVGGYFSNKQDRIVPFSDRDFQLRINACCYVGNDLDIKLCLWRKNSSVDKGINS